MTASEHAARIWARDSAWLAAVARRDLDGMVAIYAPDAELLPDLRPIVGREAIRLFYAGLLAQLPRFHHHFEAEAIIVAGSLDVAVVRGTYRFVPDTLAPDLAQTGKFIGVWRLADGDWYLQYNVSNAIAMPSEGFVTH
jgi:uncharacterized protein (TIGR02246 family)